MIVITKKICEAENGDGKGWHWYFEDQVVSSMEDVDPNIICTEHPTANTRDFAIDGEKDPVVSRLFAFMMGT